jgi:hypothetical protein
MIKLFRHLLPTLADLEYNPLKTQEVTQFLRDMVEISYRDVDDENYVTLDNKRVLLNDQGQPSHTGRPILLYQEEITDTNAYLLNPLSDGFGQPPASLWFYRALEASLAGRLHVLFQNIVRLAVDAKKTKKEDGTATTHLPMEILNIAAKISDDVDEKILDELDMLFGIEEGQEVLSIYYQKKNLRCVVRSSIFASTDKLPMPDQPASEFNTTYRSKFPKIRKKSWPVFEKLLLGALNIKTDEELVKFGQQADGLTCVRLSSLLNTLLVLYKQINPLLGYIGNGELAIDLSAFANHITKLGDYVNNARFMVQSTTTAAAPPASIPGITPIPGMASTYMQQVPNVQMGGPELIPGVNAPNGMTPTAMPEAGLPGPNFVFPVPAQPMYPGGFNPQMQQPYGTPQMLMQQPGYGYAPQQPMFQPQQPFMQQPQQPFIPPWVEQPNFALPPVNLHGSTFVPGMPQGVYR